MKLIYISDTHNKHKEISIPGSDVLIHAGDITEGGTKREVLDFLNWFSSQPHQHKIFIAGNHDFYFEKSSEKEIHEIIPDNIHYLQNNGITINGINFWGSPVTSGDGTWAFNKKPLRKQKNSGNKFQIKHTYLSLIHHLIRLKMF